MNKNHLNSLKKENKVFARVLSDFTVKALITFLHESYICFVMEYMVGGDLGSVIERFGYFDNDHAKFYAAELVHAIEYLHSEGIIHRDLKPDNVLLD